MQNDATGCGNTVHTRQTQFWELHFPTFFWTDISISDRHFPSMDQLTSHCVGIKPSLPTCWGVDPSPTWAWWIPPIKSLVPETRTSTPVPKSQFRGYLVGTPCQSSHPPNVAIPAPGCGGMIGIFVGHSGWANYKHLIADFGIWDVSHRTNIFPQDSTPLPGHPSRHYRCPPFPSGDPGEMVS